VTNQNNGRDVDLCYSVSINNSFCQLSCSGSVVSAYSARRRCADVSTWFTWSM